MPTISLRLTEEELAELREWAHDARRSIQKEIIWRLFSNRPALDRAADPSIPADPMTGADYPHFKPDFK